MNRKLSNTVTEAEAPAAAAVEVDVDVDAADLSSLQIGLSSAVNVLNSTSLTNSSSCHDWTGAVPFDL